MNTEGFTGEEMRHDSHEAHETQKCSSPNTSRTETVKVVPSQVSHSTVRLRVIPVLSDMFNRRERPYISLPLNGSAQL